MAFARTEVRELEPMVKAGKKKFVRYQEGAELYSMGLHTFEELAKEAGAIYKIRRVVLVNLEIFEEYLDTFRMRNSILRSSEYYILENHSIKLLLRHRCRTGATCVSLEQDGRNVLHRPSSGYDCSP